MEKIEGFSLAAATNDRSLGAEGPHTGRITSECTQTVYRTCSAAQACAGPLAARENWNWCSGLTVSGGGGEFRRFAAHVVEKLRNTTRRSIR